MRQVVLFLGFWHCWSWMWADTRLGKWRQRWKFRRFQKVFGVGAVHSLITPFTFNDLMIVPLPMGISNYSYLVADTAVGNQVLIDVGDATELQYLTSQPDAILTTHKHWDHSGGNKTMRRTYPTLRIYGSQRDGVPDRTHDVQDGDVLSFGRLKFTAMETPGHTHGHVMWRLHGNVFNTGENLFTGDQLWVAGRGIAHEGTNVEMVRCMKSLKELPLNTLIWPGHEQALYGLSRALHLEPRNTACAIKWNRVVKLLCAKLGTCPTTLEAAVMGNWLKSCLFGCAYSIYARTCCGRIITDYHHRMFHKAYGPNAVHSRLYPYIFNDLMILPLPVGYTNFIYLVADLMSTNFVLIDVGDASVLQYLTSQPDAILTTHKHWDHSGGNKTMRRTFPTLKIYGGEKERVPSRTNDAKDGEVLRFGRLQFTAIMTPGHTRGHIVWRLHGESFQCPDQLFTGDHLFLASVGYWFEETMVQMVKSMEALKALPKNSLIWPGHTSDHSGLHLTLVIEPDNKLAHDKLEWLRSMRSFQMPTCPSRLGEEMIYNLFMRADDQQLQQALGVLDTINQQRLDQDETIALCFKRMKEMWKESAREEDEAEKASVRDIKKRKINNKWMRRGFRKRLSEIGQEMHRMESTTTKEEKLLEKRRRQIWEEDMQRIREEVEAKMRAAEEKRMSRSSMDSWVPRLAMKARFRHREIWAMMLPHLVFVQCVTRYPLTSVRSTLITADCHLTFTPIVREPPSCPSTPPNSPV